MSRFHQFLAVATFFATIGAAHAATLSGLVGDGDSWTTIAGASVGVTRVSCLGTGEPGDPIPVEFSTVTDGSGNFTLQLDDGLAELDAVIVFTRQPNYVNQLYLNVSYTGTTPTYADAAKSGVRRIDLRQNFTSAFFLLDRVSNKTSYMLPMTDGTQLATDVYLPNGEGPWPAVLHRTTYGRSIDWTTWNDNGYACVVQDIRGCNDSEGLFRIFLDDGWGENRDGYDTCEWICAQDWCDGKISTYGYSAPGITQNFLASSVPPGLTCQVVDVAASNIYTQAAFLGGAYRYELVEGWVADRGPDALAYLHDVVLERPFYDDDYWPYLNPECRYHLANWPVVNRGGWYDIFLRGTINNFTLMQHNGQPGADGKQKLIIGPYGHGGGGEFYWPGNCFDPPAAYNDTIAWYDYWNKGIDTGVMDQPPVCYYVLGDVDRPEGPGNEWRFADDWPVPATEVPVYFREGGVLNPEPAAGSETCDTYVYDPSDPVPTLGGANLTITNGPHDQNALLSRDDVVVFTTPVLESPVEITGTVLVRLFASSDALDTDFTAKPCDVYPDGRSMLVCDGIIRARHRNTQRYEELLTPGAIYEFEIDLWEMCIVFDVGHQIRVAISSSNYPRFDANPNTGEPFNQHTHTVPATNTIYHDAERPSHILLPVTGPDANGDGVPDPADLDSDSMLDSFEWFIIRFSGDDAIVTLADVLPGDDFDGDGRTNFEEYQNGTDPCAFNYAPADINNDGSVNALDVQLVINGALWLHTGFDCDVDKTGDVDAIDIQLVINAALGLGA